MMIDDIEIGEKNEEICVELYPPGLCLNVRLVCVHDVVSEIDWTILVETLLHPLVVVGEHFPVDEETDLAVEEGAARLTPIGHHHHLPLALPILYGNHLRNRVHVLCPPSFLLYRVTALIVQLSLHHRQAIAISPKYSPVIDLLTSHTNKHFPLRTRINQYRIHLQYFTLITQIPTIFIILYHHYLTLIT